jgi:hypothetical protein
MQYIQTVLTALLIAAVLWIADTTNTNDKTLAVIAVKIEHLTDESAEIKQAVQARPSGESFTHLTNKVGDLDGEITRLRQTINAFIASGLGGE